MKRSLLALLLAAALVAPVLAEEATNTNEVAATSTTVTTENTKAKKTNLELIPKLGWIFSPEVTVEANGKKGSTSNESSFSGGLDFFFDMNNNFYLGLGFMIGDNIKPSNKNNTEVGFTNIYLAAKYKLLVNNSQKDPLYIYPLINLGVGLPGWSHDGYAWEDYNLAAGFYWAVGLGGEYKNIILEFIYACNYSKEEYNDTLFNRVSYDFSFTGFRINIGYKFAL